MKTKLTILMAACAMIATLSIPMFATGDELTSKIKTVKIVGLEESQTAQVQKALQTTMTKQGLLAPDGVALDIQATWIGADTMKALQLTSTTYDVKVTSKSQVLTTPTIQQDVIDKTADEFTVALKTKLTQRTKTRQ